MRKQHACLLLATFIGLACLVTASAQTARRPQNRQASTQPAAKPASTPQVEDAVVHSYVSLPFIATDANGRVVADLRPDEISVSEDNAPQTIGFLLTPTTPLHLVLLLDSSASTENDLADIRSAANAFIQRLRPTDEIKIISFDDQVHDLSAFTSDRAALSNAIRKTQSGQGTKLYDAIQAAVGAIAKVEGRRAIVLFTDGVDYHSDRATFDDTLLRVDGADVAIYPIRFDTRAEQERIARGQADPTKQLPTLDVVRAQANDPNAPKFPKNDEEQVTTKQINPTGTGGRIGDVMTGRRNDPYPPDGSRPPDNRQPGQTPNSRPPTILSQPSGGQQPDDGRPPTMRNPPDVQRGTNNQKRTPLPTNGSKDEAAALPKPVRRPADAIEATFDQMYATADSYLDSLATRSGGRLRRADTIAALPEAFARIAAELRAQYAIGYSAHAYDGQYRSIKITTSRANVVVRIRPGYRAN